MHAKLIQKKRQSRSGQALVEYALLLAIVAGLVVLLTKPTQNLLALLEAPLRDGFVRNYKYGDPKACGKSNDPPACSGPTRHPRYYLPDNFRVFGRGGS